MLHGAHGDAIQQCLPPLMNHRDDIWGGDFERRLRLPAASGVPLDRNRRAAAPPSPAITRLDIISPPRSTGTAISPDMPFDRAALLGCAVVTGVGAAINSAGIRPGQSVAVIGCGGVGLSAINGAAIAGAGRIIAIDRQPAKLDLARRFGATDCVEAGRDVADSIVEMTGGGVDHAIEAIGLKATVESAFAMLRPGGTATVAGMMPPGVKVEVDGFSLLAERRLQGSNMGSNHFPVDIPRYVDFYMSGRLNLDDLVAAHIELDAIDNAFAALRGGAAARSVVMFA
ncbi:zinc-binding dehydrogenase [Sphingobium fuliginis ATCC 27551]|uniref:Zinc-binding dehydrogenase n=2 Tax=Sphingobium fuliginis (strain ATCC 27551) TaxID=336203 RepID=A0A5B8CL02_SPHSA|nr:zinc-binding dehydrogenase [Sphingobium fuliginis ATCC 27551]